MASANGMAFRTSRLAGIVAAGFGLTALIGWLADLPLLATMGWDKIPMAPSTALLFIVYGAALFVSPGRPENQTIIRLRRAAAFAATLIALLFLVLSSLGIRWAAEYLGMRISGTVAGVPIGHMSPLTAFCFLLTGLSFLVQPRPAGRRLRQTIPAFGAAALLLLISVVLGMAYLLGGPLLYGSGIIPPALTTTLAFLSLAIGLLASFAHGDGLSAGPIPGTANQATLALALVFASTTACIVASGYVYSQKYQEQFRTGVEQTLAAIAALKVEDLAQWRRERLADARVFFEDERFSAAVQSLLEQPDNAEVKKRLLARLTQIQEAYRYERVSLLDRQGVELLAASETDRQHPPFTAFDPAEIFRARKATMLDFHQHGPEEPVLLTVLTPIFDMSDGQGRPSVGRARDGGSPTDDHTPLAIVVLEIDPDQYVYPLIKRWPTPSKSAETLLVQREGEEVVFLNDLRFHEKAALRLRFPLTMTRLPAAMAALGREGIVEGIDYRGVPVVAALRRVPDSPWSMVARMDMEEVYAPLRTQMWMLVGLVIALLVGSGAVIGFLWRDQMARFYRGRYLDITARKLAEKRVEHLNRVLYAIRSVNRLITREKMVEPLIRQACGLLVEHRSYTGALIVLTDENNQVTAHVEAGMGEVFRPLADWLESGKMPPCCNLARQQQGLLLIRKSGDLCAGCPIREAESERDAMCTGLKHGNQIFGYLIVTMTSESEVDAGEQELVTELADDLALALHSIRAREAMARAEEAQKTLETQLKQAQKMEAIGRLAGGVAHDFNNMLQIILGYADIALNETGPGQPVREYLEEIQKSGRRSADLTRQLLAFARKQTIAPKVLDLNETIANMLKMLQRLIGEDIDLLWKPAAACPPVLMDPSQLDQILANLVVNARDAITGVGKITIETGVAEFDEAYCEAHAGFKLGRYVLLAVSDNGIGMDQAILASIFEPFFTTKPQGMGTGLGLATVYGIIKQNRGFINVYSEPGQGSTFRIYLPQHKTMAAEAAGIKAEPVKPPTGTETVLLVEDEEALLKLSEKVVKLLGYSVLTASSPRAALEVAEHYPGVIDLLLTDVIMPEMSGRDLYQRLKELRPDLRCLYMSGYTANVISHHGVLEKGVHFIQKPFASAALAPKIREALARA